MATEVTERWSPQTTSYLTGGFSANRVFDVTEVDDENEAIGAVISAFPNTAFNEQHPKNPFMYCSGKAVARPSLKVWLVTVPYASNPAGRHSNPGDPLGEPVKYRWTRGSYSTTIDRNNTGQLLINPAGEPFTNPPQSDFVEISIVAVRNEAYFDAQNALNFTNSVSSADVVFNNGAWNFEKGQPKVVSIDPITEITEVSPYVTVQYIIACRGGYKKDSDGYWDAWKLRLLAQGRRGWWQNGGVDQRGNIVEVVNSQVQAVQQDVLLKADGTPLLAAASTSSSGYLIAKLTGHGVAGVAVATPNPSPRAGMIYETTTEGVVFIKEWPEGIKLKDHNDLGL